MDVKLTQNAQYASMDFSALYKKTKMDVDFVDENGKKIDFSMTFEDLTYSYKEESLSYTKEAVYDQAKVAEALNKGDFKALDEIFKKLTAKANSTSLNYSKTEIKGHSHSVKIEGLTPEEAKELVSKDGFFGVDKTAKRVFDFVVKGANDDPELLKAGREGVIQGLKDAEEEWGGKLPDIAYETQKKTLAMLDEYMAKLGISNFDTNA
jgi:hypothetical protein